MRNWVFAITLVLLPVGGFAEAEDWRVAGIMARSAGGWVAIVEQRSTGAQDLVKVGDSLLGGEIVNITASRIEVEQDDGDTVFLSLLDGEREPVEPEVPELISAAELELDDSLAALPPRMTEAKASQALRQILPLPPAADVVEVDDTQTGSALAALRTLKRTMTQESDQPADAIPPVRIAFTQNGDEKTYRTMYITRGDE